MSQIVAYAYRYKRPPRKRKPQPAIGSAIVTAPTPKRIVGKIVRTDLHPTDGKQSPAPTRIVHIENPRARWLRRMMER